MTKARRTRPSPRQLQLLTDDHALLLELQERGLALYTLAQEILKNLDKGASRVHTNVQLGSLKKELEELASTTTRLDAIEKSWCEQSERELLELESKIREALAALGWKVDGQWPKLYVERAIPLEFDEQARCFRISDRKISGLTATEILLLLEPLVRDLIPANFSEAGFLEGLAGAYDDLRGERSTQIPILDVYRQMVLRQQKPNFWKDARPEAFVGMSMDQFRARLSRTLEKPVAVGSGDRELRLLPPLDPKRAIFLYQPAESRFGFVGRVEFVSTKSTDD